MGKFQVISHPLIQHKLSILRRKDTSTKDFRELVNEIALLMGYEVLRDLPFEDVEIETPITKTVQKQIAGKKLAIVPILRAGIGLVDGLLSLVPSAKVGHIGMYRDEETLTPVEYLVKLPDDIDRRHIFVVDPMLATGGSAILAIDSLKKRGASNIKFVALVSAPEGVKALQEAHPDIDIYTALGAGAVALLLNEWIESRFDLPAPDVPDLGREGGDSRPVTVNKRAQEPEAYPTSSSSQKTTSPDILVFK